jgi:DNA-binding winged helix-turn-helix (wHTH) protein
MPTASTKPLCFDAYSLDLQRCSLQRGAEQIELRPKAFDVLRYLVENAGRVISKEELIKVVWPGLSVTDDALVQCVSDIRQALSDEAHRIIKTVPRRGYLVAAETCTGSQREQVPAYPTQNIKFCRTRDGVHIAMACMGRGLPLVRTATWFNHLEYDWQSPLRRHFFEFSWSVSSWSGMTDAEAASLTATYRRFRSRHSKRIWRLLSMPLA